jgi:hypothetical protein
MQLTLPPVRQFRQTAHRQNGWSDYYGAFHVVAAYASLRLPEPYAIAGIWQHGVIALWDCTSPRLLAYNVTQSEGKQVWVARADEAESLKKIGFKHARAVGLPLLYVPPTGLSRAPRSLLIMPVYSLVGCKAPDRTAHALYANEMLEAAKHFDHVTVCISPSCQKNGFWVKEFSERRFNIITGASTDDANALIRMRMLFGQFETMTANAWGSHVAYALAGGGVKVAIHGTSPSPVLANSMLDTTWKSDPTALEKLLSPQMRKEKRKFLHAFHVHPRDAMTDGPLGDWLLGRSQQITPEQMRQALTDMVAARPVPAKVVTTGMSNPRRELFLAHWPGQVNGPNIWLTRLLPALRERGFAPRVLMFVNLGAACPIAGELRAAGISCDTAPWAHTEAMIRTNVSHVQAQPCGVFVPNLNVQGYFAARLLKAAGISTVGVLHSDDDFHRDLTDEFIRAQGGRYLSAAVAVSAYQHEALLALEHGATKIVRAPYGAPVPAATAAYRAKPFRFVYVGRLVEEQKRISNTVRAMIEVLRRLPDAEFYLCGDGPARPTVVALIKAANLGHRFRLLGKQSAAERLMQDSALWARCSAAARTVIEQDFPSAPAPTPGPACFRNSRPQRRRRAAPSCRPHSTCRPCGRLPRARPARIAANPPPIPRR